jgi:hypothetical protein
MQAPPEAPPQPDQQQPDEQGDSKVRVFTVTVTPSHENHNPMHPEFLQHLLEQTGYQVKVTGGDHPCNCDEQEEAPGG